MKKIISLFMALLLLLAVLTACSKDKGENMGTTETPKVSTTEPIDTEKAVTLNLPEGLDYNCRDINILVRTSSLEYHDYNEESSGTIVGQSVFERNAEVKELLNVNLVHFHMDGYASGQQAFATAIRTSISMGDDSSYNLVSPAWYFGNALIIEGCYRDLTTLDYIELDQSYWWDGYTDQVAINGKVYTATGDYSVDALQCMEAVFFNTTMATSYKLDNPYDLVKNGEWTIDRMLQMASLVKDDLNNDNMYDTNDQMGLLLGVQAATVLPNTSGSFYITKTGANSYEVTIATEKNGSIIEKFVEAINNSSVYYWPTTGGLEEMKEMFANGKGLFMMNSFEGISKIRASSVKYGILPFPKYDTNQQEYITGTIGATVFAIPVGMNDENTEMCAAVLQAMGYYSYQYVTPAYFETTLQGQVARDSDSYANLELLRRTVVFDFGSVWMNVVKGANGGVCSCIADKSSLQTWYASNGGNIETELENLIIDPIFKN